MVTLEDDECPAWNFKPPRKVQVFKTGFFPTQHLRLGAMQDLKQDSLNR